jgi:hypothetical protein
MRTGVLLALAAAAAVLPAVGAPDGVAEDEGAVGRERPEAVLLAEQTKEYGRRLGFEIRTSVRVPFVVRGDHDQQELDRVADACARTLELFRVTLAADPAEILKPAQKGEAARLEVFVFRREKEYLAFVDQVLARIRDESVNDARLALLRRQRGFFIVTPRPMVVQYQGPSDMATVLSQAVHKTSHVLLLSHRRAGAWMPWWLLEGFATWQEFGVLRESRVYCIEVARPAEYTKPGTPEADEAAKARMEAAWKKRLRELVESGKARDLRVLARLPLNELVLEDVIQSWSFVDWLVRERRFPSFVGAYKEKREFDAACEAALGAPPAGVEQRWRTWATAK